MGILIHNMLGIVESHFSVPVCLLPLVMFVILNLSLFLFHHFNREKINTMCCYICPKVSVWTACVCKYLCLTITLYYCRVKCNRAP